MKTNMCRRINFDGHGNHGANVSKMHTVGRGVVACDIFLIGGSAMCDSL